MLCLRCGLITLGILSRSKVVTSVVHAVQRTGAKIDEIRTFFVYFREYQKKRNRCSTFPIESKAASLWESFEGASVADAGERKCIEIQGNRSRKKDARKNTKLVRRPQNESGVMKRRRISGTATEAIKFYSIVDTSAKNAALYYRRRCSCYTVSACFFGRAATDVSLFSPSGFNTSPIERTHTCAE